MIRRLVSYLVVLGAAFLWTHSLRADRGSVRDDARLDLVPDRLADRLSVDHALDARSLRILRADRVLRRSYLDSRGGKPLELFVAYFGSQETGGQIHSPQNCLPGGGWRIVSRRLWQVDTERGSRNVNEILIQKRGGDQLVLYWFLTRAGIQSNEFRLKWDLVVNSLFRRPTDAALVRVVLPVDESGLKGARQSIHAFALQLLPALERALPLSSSIGVPRRAP